MTDRFQTYCDTTGRWSILRRGDNGVLTQYAAFDVATGSASVHAIVEALNLSDRLST